MEELRNIIKDELSKLIEGRMDDLNNDFDKMINDPKYWSDKATYWANKAREMNNFYWNVSGIIGTPGIAADEKIAQISKMLPEYGWV